MFCSKCGARLNEGAQFCTSCGTPAPAAAPPPSPPPSELPAPSYTAPPAAPAYAPPAPSPAAYPHYAAPPRVDYAGFWLRVVACAIDALLWGIPILFIIVALAGAMGVAGAFKNLEPGEDPGDIAAAIGVSFIFLIFLVVLVGRWLYYAAFESSNWQGTPGKRALGLYVTDLMGSRVTFGRATGRYFARIVSGLIPFWLGYIMAGFTEKKQALHDMIAGCLVLRKL